MLDLYPAQAAVQMSKADPEQFARFSQQRVESELKRDARDGKQSKLEKTQQKGRTQRAVTTYEDSQQQAHTGFVRSYIGA